MRPASASTTAIGNTAEARDPSIDQEAIRANHGVEAHLVERVVVDERFEGEPVWRGEVLVFELQKHALAHLCYAWEVDGQVTTVLHTGRIDSPVAAVRASILAGEELAGA